MPQYLSRIEVNNFKIQILRILSAAALCWWLALTLSWGLAAVFKWSSEAIATRSALLHIIGWAVPAVLTLISVSKQEVDHGK